jgi:hypothetical protein
MLRDAFGFEPDLQLGNAAVLASDTAKREPDSDPGNHIGIAGAGLRLHYHVIGRAFDLALCRLRLAPSLAAPNGEPR